MAKLLSIIKYFFNWLVFKIKETFSRPLNFIVNVTTLAVTLYLILGVIGIGLIYWKKSESTFTKGLSVIYPYPVFMVNNSFGWASQYYRQIDFLKTYMSKTDTTANAAFPKGSELRTKVQNDMIEDSVIFLEAKSLNLNVTAQEITDAIAAQGDIADIEAKIKDLYGMNLSEYKQKISQLLLKEKVKDAVFTRVRLSIVLTSDAVSLKQAQGEITSGTDFATVASKYSQDTNSAPTGGDIGWWRYGETDLTDKLGADFAGKVFGMTVGQVSDPITVAKYGTFIVKVTDKKEALNDSYDNYLKTTEAKYRIYRFVKN